MIAVRNRNSVIGMTLPRRRYLILIALGFLVILLGTFLFQSTTVYLSQVIVEEAGGAIGINPLTDRVDFGDVPQGSAIAKTLNFENEGTVPNRIMIFVIGGIGDLVEVEPSSFTLKEGETQDVRLSLVMPDSAEVGKKFRGRVIVLRFPLRPF